MGNDSNLYIFLTGLSSVLFCDPWDGKPNFVVHSTKHLEMSSLVWDSKALTLIHWRIQDVARFLVLGLQSQKSANFGSFWALFWCFLDISWS